MLISPPFLPAAGLTFDNATATDPMMDEVDTYELAHGIYPIAFDRRWHTGVHLYPATQNEKVRAIADGEVVAYRVCQKAVDSGSGTPDSNAGFVLLKHTTDTGDGRSITFYSLYMHLLELEGYNSLGVSSDSLPAFLRMPSPGENVISPTSPPPAQSGNGLKVYRKDVLGLPGRCHGQKHIHFEIFMLPSDFEGYFRSTQLDNRQPATPVGTDYWGHSYYVIPPNQMFVARPPDTDPTSSKLNGIAFDLLQAGSNGDMVLHVETYFHKGDKYTHVWSVDAKGERTQLTAESPKPEQEYEYTLYNRATKLYPSSPSDGYELLRFGRILSNAPTLPAGAARTTWMRATFATGKEGYIDINNDAIAKLSDADFPFFTGWQKITEGNTPFSNDGMCDIGELRQIVGIVEEASYLPKSNPEYKDEDMLSDYIKTKAAVRDRLRGFICEAPTEWNSAQNETKYARLNEPDGFYGSQQTTNPNGYSDFLTLLKKFQFWDKTNLSGDKFWFFHPLKFIRNFRGCGWMSADELALTFPKYGYYEFSKGSYRAIKNSKISTMTKDAAIFRTKKYLMALNNSMKKYGIAIDRKRQSQFLAQILLETDHWNTVRGYGDGKFNPKQPATEYYAAFYGRGVLQSTWAGLYDEYGKFENSPDNKGGVYADPRITRTSVHLVRRSTTHRQRQED